MPFSVRSDDFPHLFLLVSFSVKHVEPGEEYDFVFGPNMFGPYDSAFRTFDSYDYSVIGEILIIIIIMVMIS